MDLRLPRGGDEKIAKSLILLTLHIPLCHGGMCFLRSGTAQNAFLWHWHKELSVWHSGFPALSYLCSRKTQIVKL